MIPLIILAILLPTQVLNAWRTCEEQYFCTNIRHNFESSSASYYLTDVVLENQVVANLVNSETSKSFTFNFFGLEDGTFRLTVQDPENPRFSPEDDALNGNPTLKELTLVSEDSDVIVLSTDEDIIINLYQNPFRVEVLRDGVIIIEVNKQNRLIINTDDEDKSLAVDISFPLARTAYGIPQHAERLSLPSTGPDGLSAYRLFNVDYYGFPPFTREAVYGSIPVLYGISTTITSGIFWMNAAQTFVDITNDGNGVDSLFISETGALELFFLSGPTLKECVRQYTGLTGVGPLPQYFTLGYHQSRYSYMSQDDVLTVVSEFDRTNFPMDAIWLDIDYTDGFRYFTWNYDTFPTPIEMQNQVAATGRKMVAISDPHIKVEVGYFVYDQGLAYDYFTRNADGTIFEGESWPGLSSYIDFFDPDAQDWYGELYLLENFPDTTLNLYIWNDMNEPSVNDLPDLTMPFDVQHYGGWEHRDVHNMYGFKQTQSTYGGLLKRNPQSRPFVLTRAHFAGSQRYTAMWTGDNTPSWEHLQVSIPMVLSEALAGLAFCGADIGGFIDNVTDDLLQRWYQAGIWYPFFRGHSGSNTERREPYLFSDEIQERIRRVMFVRYAHLPYWYTLFFEHEQTGDPMIRPLSYEFPEDTSVFDIDSQWLIGSAIMAAPVLNEGVTTIITRFPGGQTEFWYNLDNFLVYPGVGSFAINVDMNSALYYYRGGSIIFRIDDEVSSTEDQRGRAYTIYVFLDSNGEATGNFYLDDLESFEYRDRAYNYYRLDYTGGVLSANNIHEGTSFDQTISIDGLLVYSVPSLRSGNVQQPNLLKSKQKFSLTNLKSNFTLIVNSE